MKQELSRQNKFHLCPLRLKKSEDGRFAKTKKISVLRGQTKPKAKGKSLTAKLSALCG